MVIIHEVQFDKFCDTIQEFDYHSVEFNLFIQVDIIEKRHASKTWLKHLRDLYAKVFFKYYELPYIINFKSYPIHLGFKF